MEFILPMPPNIANGRMHWHEVHRRRKLYYQRLDLLLVTAMQSARNRARLTGFPGSTMWDKVNEAGGYMVPPLPDEPMEQARLTVHMTLGSPMDEDNAVARCKWAIDWVHTRGYMRDDAQKHLQWTAFPEQTIARKKPSVLRLTFTPLPSL